MATIESPRTTTPKAGYGPAANARTRPATTVPTVFEALASLRLAVVLLSMLLFLVFAGTCAQVEHGIWYVVREGYFRVWFAWIEFQAFTDLVNSFLAVEHRFSFESNAGFWFPGGYLIGVVMAANLLAAHTLRFKVTATGPRLLGGVATSLVGGLALAWVAVSWLDDTYVGQLSSEAADRLWMAVKASAVVLAAAGAMGLAKTWHRFRRVDWITLAAVEALFAAFAFWLATSNWAISPEAMRIVWMLVQASLAGVILLVGCWLVFQRRAGVVLLHAGILVLMAHEFYTGMFAQESNMRIDEGQTVNYSVDSRDMELAIVGRTSDESEQHAVIETWRLRQAAQSESTISDERLPVDIRVADFIDDSQIVRSEKPAANAVGIAKSLTAKQWPADQSRNTEMPRLPSAQIELIDKSSGEVLGTYFVSAWFDPTLIATGPEMARLALQPFESDGNQYEIGIRARRIYRPYSLTLLDFSFDRYSGTNKAKNFSSLVTINDPDAPERTVEIWMNNPLRYRGETFYQQSFDDQTEQTTILQVAQNEGYMLPYLSCMLVFLGMVWHFGLALTRFMSHRAQAERSQTPAARGLVVESWPRLIAPTLAAAATAAVFAYSMVPQSPPPEDLQIAEFGELPVLDDGRVKPFDTLARVTLQFLAARQEAPTQVPKQLEDGTKTSAEKIPAMQWLLDVMTAQPKALDYPVFRIENLEVLDQLGLEPRQGFFRYSFNEIDNRIRDLSDAAFAAFEKAKSGEKLTTYEKKLTELWNKRNQFVELSTSFGTPDLRGGESLRETAERAIANAKRLREANAPRAVFPEQADGQWLTFYEAALLEPVAAMQNIPPHPATAALRRALAAYADNNAKDFNDAVAQLKDLAADYEQRLRAPSNAAKLADMKPAETLRMEILAREAWLNTASLFYVASITYLIAFLFACTSWLVWQQQLSRVSLAIIGVTLLVHTFAIWQRTEISGRPPITNLYDTTICVGWACVLLGVVFEVIYRLGIGSFVASSIGFCTLIIGHYLSQDGDTFTVLQAVLDTNFWLTVHVISINLGYATTVLAGAFGVVWVLFYHLLGRLDDRGEQQVSRMIYGTVCFAILFSFVGTVLGGLWADDSWGRFWGWDPKENGAMMVVLWNAIVLHARWGGIARRRGVALLAIFGNIITAWSWFGTNGLGIGLHAYGFRDGAALNLVLFCVANLAIIAAGAIRWRTVSTSTASLSRNA